VAQGKNKEKIMKVETCSTALLTLTVLALLSSGFAYADNIYVSCYGAGTIERFGSSENGAIVASGLDGPGGLAFDNNGYLYVSNWWDGTIKKFNSSGNMFTFASGLNDPLGLAFDSNGYLYVANANGGTIMKFDSNGNGSTFASGLNSPYCLALDNSGYLYAAMFSGDTIVKFDSNGNGSTFASSLSKPWGLACDSNGYLYVANYGNGTIEKFDSNGNGSTFASDLNSPAGLAFDNNGYLYTANFSNGTIVKVDSNGNATLFASGLSYPVCIATQIPVKVTKCSVTAGSKENTDKISFSGTMNATFDDFNDANDVNVKISSVYMDAPYVQTFDINDKTFKKGKFSSTITNKPSKTSFAFDTKKMTFSFSASNIDLIGLSCPVGIEIWVGGWTDYAEVHDAIVNGPETPIPINLLMGVEDSLRVDKSKFTIKSDSITQFAVSGGFSVEHPDVNMTNRVSEGLVITLGTQTFTIPANKLKAGKGKFTCLKANVNEGGIATATFDFSKCTFSLTIKNTNFIDSGTVDFCAQFAGFSECALVTLP
jgi:sugar lactone lactonase YvrE